MSTESLANPAPEQPEQHQLLPQIEIEAPAEVVQDEQPLEPPVAPGLIDDPANRTSYGAFSNQSTLNNLSYYDGGLETPRDSTLLVDKDKEGAGAGAGEYAGSPEPPVDIQAIPDAEAGPARKRRWLLLAALAILAIVIVVVAVAVPVAVTHKKKSGSSSSSGNSSGGNSGGPAPTPTPNPTSSGGAISGGQGSTITTEDGTTFVYQNTFGGIWYQDPNDPFNNNAQAQSWSKPLNQSWEWGVDVVRGVNLGGWLVPEPFIVPALFEKYMNNDPPAKDEWSLCQNMANDTAGGGLNQLEDHYKTFITEQDFAAIASAGLNWVRLPIPYWAITKFPDEPFLEGVAWTYALKAFAWARKYGLRINLDLHTMPGSQNGYNHSGKGGQVDFLYGVMGLANAERGLDYLRIITEFISQPEYSNVIPYFGIMNEALIKTIGPDVIGSFYLEAFQLLRNITGIGEGKGPYLSVHDGFYPLSSWANFLPGGDRIALDSHPYMCFGPPDPSPLAEQTTRPCAWGNNFNTSWNAFGVTTAGEWSLAWNDCGYWVNGVNSGSRWAGTLSVYSGPNGGEGPDGCDQWNDWQTWNETVKSDLQQLALASMDALQNWFFWTWKIGNSSVLGTVGSPFWSYSLGLEQGWMPPDPRAAVGVCGGTNPVSALAPSQTGGAGSGQFSEALLAANPWPPVTMAPGGWSATLLPTYTQTGMPIPTLPMPTFTGAAAAAAETGNGWFDPQDTAPMFTPIAGCTYPDGWNAVDVALPPVCTG